MDQMDYILHNPDPAASQVQQSHHGSCPHWRGEASQSSLPNPAHLGSSLNSGAASSLPHLSMRNVPSSSSSPPSHPPMSYDPVHSASNSWFSPPTHSFQWTPTSYLQPPHPQVSAAAHAARPAISELYFSSGLGSPVGSGPGVTGTGISSAGAPNSAGGSSSVGTSSPGLIHSQSQSQNQTQQLSGPDPFTAPPAFHSYRRIPPPAPPQGVGHRVGGFNPSQPPHHHHHHSHHHSSHISFGSDRPAPLFPPQNPHRSLPALNPPPHHILPPPTMSNMANPPEPIPVLQGRGPGAVVPPSMQGYGLRSYDHAGSYLSDSDPALPSTPPVPPNTERRRTTARPRARLSTSHSDDSEDDLDPLDDDQQTIRFIETFTVGMPQRGMDESHVRAHQLLRGQMSNKRVASRKALASLESVDISTLSDNDKMCVICYNEYGVENPEGINEAPLRLPHCKHIFGDHCIKKWFEESDSCPYCRDKVPSEPQLNKNHQAVRDLLRQAVRYRRPDGSTARQFPMIQDPERMSALVSDRARVAVMSQRERERDDSRGGVSPPRAWQTGERRSPPSELVDSQRRTRPRHGSFPRTSSSANNISNRPTSYVGQMPALVPPQHSPTRDRPYHRSYASYGRFGHLAFQTDPLGHNAPAGVSPPSAFMNQPSNPVPGRQDPYSYSAAAAEMAGRPLPSYLSQMQTSHPMGGLDETVTPHPGEMTATAVPGTAGMQ